MHGHAGAWWDVGTSGRRDVGTSGRRDVRVQGASLGFVGGESKIGKIAAVDLRCDGELFDRRRRAHERGVGRNFLLHASDGPSPSLECSRLRRATIGPWSRV